MANILLEHQTLVALYAYLRHLDLSLDRSRWGPWQDYVTYSQSQVAPAVIAQFLQRKCYGVEAVATSGVIPDHSYSKLRLLYLARTLMQRNNYLTSSEVAYMWQALKTYQSYLATDWDTYSVELEKLRLRIARFCYTVLEAKLSHRELRHTMRIEHYLSAYHLQTVPLQSFLTWLK
jgi:hypothetical protein